jgi:hypothetical protein
MRRVFYFPACRPVLLLEQKKSRVIFIKITILHDIPISVALFMIMNLKFKVCLTCKLVNWHLNFILSLNIIIMMWAKLSKCSFVWVLRIYFWCHFGGKLASVDFMSLSLKKRQWKTILCLFQIKLYVSRFEKQ